jgi:predicted enzyme related to lactoylglutathione lyase
MNPVRWFEIPVRNIERASRFYEQVLGLKLSPTDMGPAAMAWFPLEQGAPGAAGSLVKADGYTPSHQGSLVYFGVENIDRTLEQVKRSGGRTLLARTSIGEHGFIAHVEDTEGNRVAFHSTQ